MSAESVSENKSAGHVSGDMFGGLAAMLVAMPSAIAFGLVIFNPLGPAYAGAAAVAGVVGTIAMGCIAPIFGGTSRLVSAPCAPAAALLSVFVMELLKQGSIPVATIPFYVVLAAFFAGIFQLLAGYFGGGKFIKYIPYPVVAGYLSGVGVLILLGQFPKFLGLPKGVTLGAGVTSIQLWHWPSICVGVVTILVMMLAPRIIRSIPAAIIGLFAGIACYFLLSLWIPELATLENNKYVIGSMPSLNMDYFRNIANSWSSVSSLNLSALSLLLVPMLTLAVLLSIDTLKTCVVLDALTQTRHDSNRELRGQGLANMVSAMAFGIPGAGTMGATLVNLSSGAKTRLSGVLVGVFAAVALVVLGKVIVWIPIAALAGILIVVGVRMVDRKSIQLLNHRSTVFDFLVILAVILSAVSLSLIAAAGVGIAMAILLFLREQTRFSVVRRSALGNQIFSKKKRLTNELAVLEAKGAETVVLELQGQLFFGTTDQLFLELEPFLLKCRYIVLDMRRVQSVDFTAANMLKQIRARIQQRQGYMIFSSLPLSLPTGKNVKDYFGRLGLSEGGDELKYFQDMDSALEWVEDEILIEANLLNNERDKILELSEIEFFSEISEDALKTLNACVKERTLKAGELVFKRGMENDEMYFIRKGTVKIVLELSSGLIRHLATFGHGDFFGDMAFLDKGKRSANAICVGDVSLFVLSRNEFDNFSEKHPEIKGKFFERLAYVISKRLRQTDIELGVLEGS